MRYAHPGTEGAIVSFKAKYGNYIGGEFVAPVDGNYFSTPRRSMASHRRLPALHRQRHRQSTGRRPRRR